MQPSSTILLFILFSSITACMAENITELPIMPEKLASSLHCQLGQRPAVMLVASQQQLERVIKQVGSNKIQSGVNTLPFINFINEQVVAVSMGQQRTGGYGLRLTKQPISIKDGEATLSLHVSAPKRGMMTIQMLTSPCLLVKIPKGTYQFLRVVTQAGKPLGVVKIK